MLDKLPVYCAVGLRLEGQDEREGVQEGEEAGNLNAKKAS